MKYRIAVFVLLIALAASLAPQANADIQPAPGQLYVVNDMHPANSSCSGHVSMTYGLLPSQASRFWRATVDADCTITVVKGAVPDSPNWGPFGPVYATFFASDGEREATMEVDWFYSTPGSCPPQRTGWRLEADWGWYDFGFEENGCTRGLWYIGTAAESTVIFQSWAGSTTVNCYADVYPTTLPTAVAHCQNSPYPSLPVVNGPGDLLGQILSGEAAVFTIGSGL